MRAPPGIELYVLILWAHLRFIVTMVVAAAVTAVGLTYFFSEKYYADAKVLVRPREEATLVSRAKESFGYPIGLNIPIGTIAQTHEQMLQNPVLLGEIVDRLQLAAQAPPPEGQGLVVLLKQAKLKVKRWFYQAATVLKYGRLLPEDPRSEAIEKLGRALKARPTADTYVMEIRSEASDPALAGAIANQAAQLLEDLSRDLTSSNERDFRIYLEERLADAESELSAARRELESFKTRSGLVVLEEEAVLGLRSEAKMLEELRELESTRAGLIGLYGDSHPRVHAIDAQIALITDKLEGTLRPRLRRLPKEEADMGRLALALDTAEARYRLVREQVEQARIDEANRQSTIQIVSEAVAPTAPGRPIKVLYGGLAAVLALVLALAWSLIDDFLWAPIYTAEQSESVLGVPSLAALPPLGTR